MQREIFALGIKGSMMRTNERFESLANRESLLAVLRSKVERLNF